MKRISLYITATIVAALAIVVLAGCSSQSASSTSASAASSISASTTSAQSQDEIIAELKDALANAPAYKSVTVTESLETTFMVDDEAAAGDSSASAASSEVSSSASATSSAAADEPSAEPEVIEAKSVYKFDASGDKLKTCMTGEIGDYKIQYFSDGNDAVCVTDGPVYSGTTEQFGMTYAAGVDAYIANEVGDLNALIDCAASVEKMESNGLTFYMLTLDPKKYIASDEILTLMADSGTPVKEAFFTIGFEEDGSIASMDLAVTYEKSKNWRGLMFSDYDSTVIDPMPEANKTYEEMEEDMTMKVDALYEGLDTAESAAGSSEVADVR